MISLDFGNTLNHIDFSVKRYIINQVCDTDTIK